MKHNLCMNHDCHIVYKTVEDTHWHTIMDNIHTPATIMFAISSSVKLPTNITKIVWDFGNGNQNKTFTNRKYDLQNGVFECKYKKRHNTTVVIQASVYTDSEIFVTPPLQTITTNTELKEHYVEPDIFKEQILKYYKTKTFSNDVADSIYKIANRLAFAPNFINYSYREEMVGDAVVRMIEALTTEKFDPDKGNPFSYFTKIAFHAFCNRIKKEKRMRDALANYQNDVYNDMVDVGMIPYHGTISHKGDDESYFHEDT